MKLYIWENPIDLGYGACIVFAMANTLREAQTQALLQIKESDSYTLQIEITRKKLAHPTHVYNKPSAGLWSYQE